jgi:hypothetical protein
MSSHPPGGSVRVMWETGALKGERDPPAPGVGFRAGLMLPKSVNFDAVSDNRIGGFRIKTHGVGMTRKRW